MASCIPFVGLLSTSLRRYWMANHTVHQWTGGVWGWCCMRCCMGWWVRLKMPPPPSPEAFSTFGLVSAASHSLHFSAKARQRCLRISSTPPCGCTVERPRLPGHSCGDCWKDVSPSAWEGAVTLWVCGKERCISNAGEPRGADFSVCVCSGRATGTFLFRAHRLGWPPGPEAQTPVHPQRGRNDSDPNADCCASVCSCVALLQTGPCDVSYIDPEFTLQPVPDSVNERCRAGPVSEAFPGFSFVNPAEYVVSWDCVCFS